MEFGADTRSVGIQKYLPVVVSTSKLPASRSSASRKSSNAGSLCYARRVRAARLGGLSLSAASVGIIRHASPPAPQAAAAVLGRIAEEFRHAAIAEQLPSRHVGADSWRNSATTIAVDGSIAEAASSSTSARSRLPVNTSISASSTRALRSVGALRTAACAAATASSSLPARNRSPGSPSVLLTHEVAAPGHRPPRSVTSWKEAAMSSSW